VDRDIEFKSIKGNQTVLNQDNMFILVDNDIKIFAVFDGHGVNGHHASNFACGKMLQYIRNESHDFFRKKNLNDPQTHDKDIEKNIKLCFKYV